MHADEDGEARRPEGLVERMATSRAGGTVASYAGMVPRVRRRLPAAGSDRRTTPRLESPSWRGYLVDRRH